MASSSLGATIRRDSFGVPHIYGEMEADVLFGFGYAQAEDHLEKMMRNIYALTGRLSEAFGEEYLEQDFELRRYVCTSIIRETYEKLDAHVRELVDAFADGINLYIGENQGEIPDWIKPVAGFDIILAHHADNLCTWHLGALKQRKKMPGGLPEGLERLHRLEGYSNSWVVGPSKSESGKVILFAGPHVGFASRHQMYEAHLCGGGLDVAGATLFGVPFLIMGFNPFLAWGITISWSDTTDVFEEKLNPENPKQYLHEGEWHDMEAFEESFEVKAPGGMETIRREMLCTRHGPVIKREGDRAYTILASTWREPFELDELYRVNLARNLEEFKGALSGLRRPHNNYVYGDRDGNTYYVWHGPIPRRAEGLDSSKPLPGWKSEAEWKGTIGFEELPHVENPPDGFLVNCNSNPGAVSPCAEVICESDEPYVRGLVGSRLHAERGRRAQFLITTHEKIGFEQAKEFALDQCVIDHEGPRALLVGSYDVERKSIEDMEGNIHQAVELVRGWDGHAHIDSAGMSVFYFWFVEMEERGGCGDFCVTNAELRSRSLDSLKAAVGKMIGLYGSVAVKWGEVQVVERGGEFYPLGGAGAPLLSLHKARGKMKGGKLISHFGQLYTLVVTFEERIKAASVVPFGNSENPSSPHFADQAPLVSKRELKPLPFSKEEVEAATESVKRVTVA